MAKLPDTNTQAIGLLEVQGMVCAIEGLDSMLKAADVRLIHCEKKLGGWLVTMVIQGEVSAVRAAVSAGAENAAHIGTVKCQEVIARPHEEILKFLLH